MDMAATFEAANHHRYPALEKLAWSVTGKGRIPWVQQLQSADCGAACLAMVLGHHGCNVSLEEATQAVGVTGMGATASAILEGAARFGLRGRGVQLDVHELEMLPRGSILHWNFQHFVVFESATPRGIVIVDPAVGRRTVPMARVRKAFTGVALTLQPGDEFVRRRLDKRGMHAYLSQLFGQRTLLGRLIWTSLLLRLLGLAAPAFSGVLVDRVVPRGDLHLLWVLGGAVFGMLIFQVVTSIVRGHMMLQLRTNLDTRMTLGLMDHLVSLPLDYYRRRSTGDLLARVNSNATIRETLSSTALQSLLDGVVVLLYVIALLVVSLEIGLITLAIIALDTVAYLFIRRRYRDLQTEGLEVRAQSQNYLVQMLSGVETLKLAGAEQRSVQTWSNLYVDELNTGLRAGRLSLVYKAVLDTIGAGGPLIIMGCGAMAVISGEMTLGTLIALSALVAGALGPVRGLLETCLSLDQTAACIERVEDVLSQDKEQDPRTVSAVGQLHGRITLHNVTFGYDRHRAPVLRDVSLDVMPGTMVALVGRSGSGKSTLASLMAGLHKPGEGTIRFDGRDMSTLDVRDLRRHIGVVTQDPYMFGNSVRANIALSDPDMDVQRVMAAAQLAGIHEDIASLPMGYDTILADGGASMSGGQCQRIALARALARQPRVVLLDEATSALDTVKEAEVMDNIARLHATRIVIAHRLSTVKRADVILVMDHGQIVERGTHDELMRTGRIYPELVGAQTADTQGDKTNVKMH